MINSPYYRHHHGGNRFVPFAGPFLLGALTGGVALAATRPRPYVYPYYPAPYPTYYPYYY